MAKTNETNKITKTNIKGEIKMTKSTNKTTTAMETEINNKGENTMETTPIVAKGLNTTEGSEMTQYLNSCINAQTENWIANSSNEFAAKIVEIIEKHDGDIEKIKEELDMDLSDVIKHLPLDAIEEIGDVFENPCAKDVIEKVTINNKNVSIEFKEDVALPSKEIYHATVREKVKNINSIITINVEELDEAEKMKRIKEIAQKNNELEEILKIHEKYAKVEFKDLDISGKYIIIDKINNKVTEEDIANRLDEVSMVYEDLKVAIITDKEEELVNANELIKKVLAFVYSTKRYAIRKFVTFSRDKKKAITEGSIIPSVMNENRVIRQEFETIESFVEGKFEKNFLPNIINIQCQNNSEIFEAICTNGLFVQEGNYACAYTVCGDYVVNIVKGIYHKLGYVIRKEGDKLVAPEGYRLYKFFNSTPSSEKSSMFSALDVTDGDRRFEILNKYGNGFLGLMKDDRLNKASLIKTASRTGIFWSGTFNLGQFKTYALYTGKFGDSKMTGLKNPPHAGSPDGKATCSIRAIVRFIEETIVKRPLNQKEKAMAYKMFIQAKPTSDKCATTVSSDLQLKVLIENIVKEGSVVHINDCDPANLPDETIVIFGEWDGSLDNLHEKIEFLTDDNAHKTNMIAGADLSFEISSVAKDENQKTINTSVQQLSKILYRQSNGYTQEQANELIFQLAMRTLSKDLNILRGQRSNALPKLKDNEAVYSLNLAHLVNAGIYKNSSLLTLGYINHIFDDAKSKITKMKFEIDGSMRYILVGFETELGYETFLNNNEIFVPGIREKEIFIMRYPCPDMVGGFNVKTVNLKTIEKRMKAVVTNEEHRKAILDSYKNISTGCAVISAYEEIKKMLEGADHDFDSIFAVTDQRFVNIMKNRDYVVIHKDSSEESQGLEDSTESYNAISGMIEENKKYNVTKMEDIAYACQYASGNSTETEDVIAVGPLTKMASATLALLADPEYATEHLQKHFGNKGKGEYSSLFDVDHPVNVLAENEGRYKDMIARIENKRGIKIKHIRVSKSIVERVKENIKNCDLTNRDNQIKVIFDLDFIYSYYQETTIDAYKKANFPELLVTTGKKAMSALDLEPEFSIDFKTKKVSYKFKEEEKYVIKDFKYLKERICDEFVLALNSIISNVMSSKDIIKENAAGVYSEYIQEGIMKKFKIEEKDITTEQMNNMQRDNRLFKLFEDTLYKFASIAGNEIKRIQKTEEKLDAAEKTNAVSKKEIKWLVKAVQNALRLAIRTSVSNPRETHIKRFYMYQEMLAILGKKFMYSHRVCQEEMILALTELEGSNNCLASRFYGKVPEGCAIKLVDGQSKYGYTEEKLNGFFKIEKYDNTLYAIRNIDEELNKRIHEQLDRTFVLNMKDIALPINEETSLEQAEFIRFQNLDAMCFPEYVEIIPKHNDPTSGIIMVDGHKICKGECDIDSCNYIANRKVKIERIYTDSFVDEKNNCFRARATLIVTLGDKIKPATQATKTTKTETAMPVNTKEKKENVENTNDGFVLPTQVK